MSEMTLYVGGMGCRRCVREVTARLRDVPGVQMVVADSATSTVRLGGSMTVEDVLDAFVGTTYRTDLVCTAPRQSPDSGRCDARRTHSRISCFVTQKGLTMSSTSPSAAPGSRRWLALGLIAAAQFMVIMDTSIIGVALPEIQQDLGFTSQGLSWVFNAYVVAFGGLLLLGGRLSDLLGARRVFSAGWVVLAVGSLVAGAAGSPAVELVGRAVQGAGSA